MFSQSLLIRLLTHCEQNFRGAPIWKVLTPILIFQLQIQSITNTDYDKETMHACGAAAVVTQAGGDGVHSTVLLSQVLGQL